MGLFSGSSETKTNEKFDTGPSSFQKPYLTDAFGSAQDLYKSKQGTPYYQGEMYAGMSDEAKKALESLKGYATTTGLGSANQLSSIGSNLAGYGDRAASTIDSYAQMAGQDPTQANIASANAYADNPAINGMIDASSRDVTRNLNENTLPSIDRAASATGNINSSRAGIASGVAQRGAADRIGDISASIRGDAYNRGLSLAQNDRSTNLNAMGNAAGAYRDLAGFGVDALTAGTASGYDAFGQIGSANQQEQTDRQGQDTADFTRWQGNDTRAQDLLNNYYSTIGGNQWGQSGTSSGTSTSTQNNSILGTIAGLGSAAASIYTGFKK